MIPRHCRASVAFGAIVIAAVLVPAGPATAKPRAPVEHLDAGPLSVRGDTSVISTGHEIVVWGGDVEAFNMGVPGPSRSFEDGAAYNVARDEWRAIPAAPIADDAEYSYAVWAGDRMVAYRGTHGAAWDPTSNTWSALPDAPGEVTALVWTGAEVIALGANARLDPTGETWEMLPEPPIDLLQTGANWTGHELLIVGRVEHYDVPASNARGIAYDPATNRWRELAPSNINAQAIDTVWDGNRLIVVNYDMAAASYDPTDDRWQPLPDVPARFAEFHPYLGAVNGRTVAFMATSIVVLTENDRWIPLPYSEVTAGQSAAVGDDLFVFGFGFSYGDEPNKGNRFGRIHVVGASATDEIQVGIATLTLPRGYDFERAYFEVSDEGIRAQVIVVDVSHGRTECTIASSDISVISGTYLDPKVNAKEIKIATRGGESYEARVGPKPDRAIVLHGMLTTDAFGLRCDKPADARTLARSLSSLDWG